jgi:hypothetical protein
MTNVIGNTVKINFKNFGDSVVAEGKVDTGATTSSLHATDIKLNSDNTVTFLSDCLSENLLTIPLVGEQDVLTADAGSNSRPIISLDISINGRDIPKAHFNLNDRSEMDCPILIGENIIKAGDFIIDINNDTDDNSPNVAESVEKVSDRTANIMEAVRILKEHDVTIYELVEFLRTAPIYLRTGHDS